MMDWTDNDVLVLLDSSGRQVFYGTVAIRDGEWWGTRSGFSDTPPLGPFASREDAVACVESWARSHVEWLYRCAVDDAAHAAGLLMALNPG